MWVAGRGRCACSARRGPGQAVADQFAAGGDAELGEHLPQVIFDGPGAEEQLCRDLLVGQPAGDQPSYLQFLRGQLLDRGDIPLARGLPGRPQLRLGPFGPGRRAQRAE